METNWIPIASLVVSVIAIVISIIALCVKKKQYLSTLRPELWTNGWVTMPMKKQVVFDIENRSENTAIIKDVIPQGKNITLNYPFRRYALTNKDALKVVCDYHGKSMDGDRFKLKIKYADREGNSYTAYLFVNEKGNWIE